MPETGIHFMGAAQTVTGSRHLFGYGRTKFLLDCGMFQDKISIKADRNLEFGFDPTSVDFVILSHAHIDHSGSLPRLVKLGFRGKIYSTAATRDLCEVMLADSAHIQVSDTEFRNQRRKAKGKPPLEPAYTPEDVKETMTRFQTVGYEQLTEIVPGLKFRFTDAGHILGSAAVSLELKQDDSIIHVTFTGDIGRFHDLILKEPQPFPQADYILCESTYGDRLHEATEDAALLLMNAVRHTCIEKKGKLLIPAFSLGRTQEIVYTLDRMQSNGLLPRIPVYVDSPLSVDATEIMRHHPECFNAEIKTFMEKDPDPFGFRGLKYIQDVNESKALNFSDEPCIIISASGMLDAGRIKHHVRNNIGKKSTTILMAGYCAPNTLGADLLNGDKKVRIFGEMHEVKAEVIALHSYSAHADYKEILRFLGCQDSKKVKTLFLVHGEPEVQQHFRTTLEKEGFANVQIPALGDYAVLK
ncbi:MAG TPA: MBL fold metallo-hydrolase [Bacteroidia bacterium]|nr:MBL fold metallo-hydrolase [Bacteroidia bacterium]